MGRKPLGRKPTVAIGVRFDPETYALVARLAEEEHRSLNGQVLSLVSLALRLVQATKR